MEKNIMTLDYGHNITLVNLINEHWRENKDKFVPILKALFARDWVKMVENNLDNLEWESKVKDYLNNLADNQDLVTILNYLGDRRMDYFIKKLN